MQVVVGVAVGVAALEVAQLVVAAMAQTVEAAMAMEVEEAVVVGVADAEVAEATVATVAATVASGDSSGKTHYNLGRHNTLHSLWQSRLPETMTTAGSCWQGFRPTRLETICV